MGHIQNLYFLSISLYILGVIGYFKANKLPQLIFLFIFIQASYISINVFISGLNRPFCAFLLLLGPILFLIYLSNLQSKISLKTKFIHFLPFISIIVKDILSYNFDRAHYQNSYQFNLVAGAISQIIYASWIYGRQRSVFFSTSSMFGLLKKVSFIIIVNGIFSILTQLQGYGLNISFGFNGNYLSYFLYLLIIILLVRDLWLEEQHVFNTHFEANIAPLNQQPNPERYKYSSLEIEALINIEKRVNQYLSEEKAFLYPDITIQQLSEKLNISKSHLSQTFNTYMGKSFYRILAEHRIEYALALLQKNKNLKIEAMAHNSGFNSISTFNRYFKEIIGMQPSVYIRLLHA